jgi:hypothetical protein
MTVASVIISRAFRENNLIPIGRAPSLQQTTEALQILNSGLRALPGSVFSEMLADWPVPANQRVGDVAANAPLMPGSQSPGFRINNAFPSKNYRIVWDGSERTVYFPELPDDGARMGLIQSAGNGQQAPGLLTLSGNGRTIEGAATFLSTTATKRNWLYRSDLGDWVAIFEDLAATDPLPFPEEFDDYFITGLAIRMTASYGKTIQATTTETNKRVGNLMRARYTQHTPEGRGGENLVPGYESFWTGFDC